MYTIASKYTNQEGKPMSIYDPNKRSYLKPGQVLEARTPYVGQYLPGPQDEKVQLVGEEGGVTAVYPDRIDPRTGQPYKEFIANGSKTTFVVAGQYLSPRREPDPDDGKSWWD